MGGAITTRCIPRLSDGPFVGDDKFAVYYNYDVTFKPTGNRTPMEEWLCTRKDGKVVREQFFYRTS